MCKTQKPSTCNCCIQQWSWPKQNRGFAPKVSKTQSKQQKKHSCCMRNACPFSYKRPQRHLDESSQFTKLKLRHLGRSSLAKHCLYVDVMSSISFTQMCPCDANRSSRLLTNVVPSCNGHAGVQIQRFLSWLFSCFRFSIHNHKQNRKVV